MSTGPAIRALFGDIAIEGSNPNRKPWRYYELRRQRAAGLLAESQSAQDSRVKKVRRTLMNTFVVEETAYVIKKIAMSMQLTQRHERPIKHLDPPPQWLRVSASDGLVWESIPSCC